MKKLIFTLAITICLSPVQAAGWTPPLLVEQVVALDDGMVTVYTYQKDSPGQSITYTTGCQANSWVLNTSDNTAKDRMVSMLLTAAVAGKTVSFWYGDTCHSYANNHTAIHVQFRNNN